MLQIPNLPEEQAELFITANFLAPYIQAGPYWGRFI